MENEEKRCKNCRYFAKHYVKHNSGLLCSCDCGNCLNNNIHVLTAAKINRRSLPCEYWEPEIIQKEKRRASIKDVLENMARRLDDIAIVLKDDDL